jgi:PleD family two-component response regulator
MTTNREQEEALRAGAFAAPFNMRIVTSEYSLGAAVEMFPPDFVVVDSAIGVERTREITRQLADDPRLQTVRVVLATQEGEAEALCEEKVFARIDRPFEIRGIGECIREIRDSVD